MGEDLVRKVFFRFLNPLHILLLSLEKKIFSESSNPIVTAISKKGREEIFRHYGLDKIPVIYNGVNTEEFSLPKEEDRISLRDELGLTADAKLILYVGGGFFRKGLSFLIDAFSELPIKTREKTFLLVIIHKNVDGKTQEIMPEFFGSDLNDIENPD